MMRYRVVLMVCVLLACPSWALAAGIVVFGDSLSDIGNVYTASRSDPELQADPPSPPYFEGRMSNGPVWVEHLADRLRVKRPTASLDGGLNFAYAGATTGPGTRQRPSIAIPGQVQAIANVGQQIEDFFAVQKRVAPHQLVVLWAGANDLFEAVLAGPEAGEGVVTSGIANIERHLRRLEEAGARQILVPNQIDASDAPFWKGFGPAGLPEGSQQLLADFTGFFNTELENMLDMLAAEPTFSARLIQPDMFGLVKAIFENPTAFEFTNIDEPAFPPGVGVVADASGNLWWDPIHPTTEGHRAIADNVPIRGQRPHRGASRPAPRDAAEVALLPTPVPATFPLMTMGLAALVLVARRER